MIQVLDKSFEIFITSEEIHHEIVSLAGEINADYRGREVVFIAVLNGAFMFASDMMKQVSIESEISFCSQKSLKFLSPGDSRKRCPCPWPGWVPHRRTANTTPIPRSPTDNLLIPGVVTGGEMHPISGFLISPTIR